MFAWIHGDAIDVFLTVVDLAFLRFGVTIGYLMEGIAAANTPVDCLKSVVGLVEAVISEIFFCKDILGRTVFFVD